MDAASLVDSRLACSARAIDALQTQRNALAEVIVLVREALGRGATVFTCGNGGSAAQALHLAEELVGRYKSNRPALRAVCLNADPTALTCIANDFGFEEVFARQVQGLARTGDVLVVLSTSGRSANLLRAVDAAEVAGVTTIGLLGGDGGETTGRCSKALVVNAPDSAGVQEAHLMIIHMICEGLEPHAAPRN